MKRRKDGREEWGGGRRSSKAARGERERKKFVKQRLFEMEEKIERLEVEIKLCRRRKREMKAELESGKKEREDLAKRVKCLESKLEKENEMMVGKKEKEKERSKLKGLVCKPAIIVYY